MEKKSRKTTQECKLAKNQQKSTQHIIDRTKLLQTNHIKKAMAILQTATTTIKTVNKPWNTQRGTSLTHQWRTKILIQ